MTDYLVEQSLKSLVFWFVGIVAWVFVGVLGFGVMQKFPEVPADKWQAVFLSNSQVYFGKLTDSDAHYVALSDVYYLRTAADLDQNQSASSLNLIKLGGEVHGPEDIIYIPKNSILFWENMKDSSRVVQTINTINNKQ